MGAGLGMFSIKPADGENEGPVAINMKENMLEKRSCTDIPCCLLFLFSWVVWLIVTCAYASSGNPAKLYQPRDYQGAYCGVKEQWNTGPDLENQEKLSFMMNVTESVDIIAKQLLCSSASQSYLTSTSSTLTAAQQEDYMCACCLTPCQSCDGSIDVGGDLASESSLQTTISNRMGDLTGTSATSVTDLFAPGGSNGDLFSGMWDEATKYFVQVCLPSCDTNYNSLTGDANARYYTYTPGPDSPLVSAWDALKTSGPQAIRDTISQSFQFEALPSSICPYSPAHCVPFPGVEFEEVSVVNYCTFQMATDVINAVGGAAAGTFETLGGNDVSGHLTETFGSWVGDFFDSIPAFIVVAVLSFVIGLVFLVLLRFLLAACVWFAIILMFVVLMFAGGVSYVRSYQCAGAGLFESGQQTATAVAIAGATTIQNEVTGTEVNEDLVGDGATYIGVQQYTINARQCQSWDVQTVHQHTYTSANYPDANLANNNYCRNPYSPTATYHADTIWCFTTDTEKRWEECMPVGVLKPECDNGYAVSGESTRKALEIIAYIIWAIAGLWVIVVICMQRRIRLAIALNEVGAEFLVQNPKILLVPIIESIVGILWTLIWAVSAAFLISQVPDDYTPTGYYATYAEAYGTADTPGKCNDVWPTGFVWKDVACDGTAADPKCWRCAPPRYVINVQAAISFFCYLWDNAFIIAVGQTTIAMAVGLWFFSSSEERKRGNTGTPFKALKLVFRYHTGSLAFGAFIIAAVQFARYVCKYFEKQAQAQKNKVMVMVLKAVQCCLWCFEKCLKYLTKHVYIQVALKGKNFCRSAYNSFTLMFSNALRFGAVLILGNIIHVIGYVFVTAATAGLGYLVLRAMYPNVSPVVPMVIYMCMGYMVGNLFMHVFGLAVNTSLHCYMIVENGEHNDRDSVPPPLKKFFTSDKYIDASKEVTSG